MSPNTPYVGLRPFNRDEHNIFFGRENCVNDLVEILEHNNFFAVVGDAYCGKSSLLNCGLEARLLQNNETNSILQWHIVNFRPKHKPFTQLTEALLHSDSLGDALRQPFENETVAQQTLQQNLIQSSFSLHLLLNSKSTPLPKGHKLLLVCDQFEDIFHLYQHDRKKAQEFINFLLDSTKPDPINPNSQHHIHVILVLRSNYLEKCSLFPQLTQAIKNTLYLTPRLNKTQIKEAITEPCRLFKLSTTEPSQNTNNSKKDHPAKIPELVPESSQLHLEDEENIDHFLNLKKTPKADDKKTKTPLKSENKSDTPQNNLVSPQLLDELLTQIDASQDQLPRLQHLLKRLWSVAEITQAHSLNLDLYQKARILNFENALNLHLEEVYEHLNDQQQPIAQIMFRQLTDVKEDSRPRLLHVPVSVNSIAELSQKPTPEVIKVIEFFRQPEGVFLLPKTPVELTASTQIEISHESVVRHWKRLHDWKQLEHQNSYNYHLLNERSQEKAPLLKHLELYDLWTWSQQEHFNEHWADHYQCYYADIRRYLIKSKWVQNLQHGTIIGGVIGLCFLAFLGWQKNSAHIVQQQAQLTQHSEKIQEVTALFYDLNPYLVTPANSEVILKAFKSFVGNRPENSTGWFFYGLALEQQQQWQEAALAFSKAHQLQSQNAHILYHLGFTQHYNKDYPQAIASFKNALKYKPKSVKTLIALGDTLNLHQQAAAALESYQQALKIETENAIVLGKIAQILVQKNNYPQAVEYLQKAVEINPTHEENWRNLGLTYAKQGLLKQALQALDKALKINGRNDINWQLSGRFFAELKKYAKATQFLNEACKLNPDNDQNWLHLGHILRKNNQPEQALKSYQKAINLNPSSENFNFLAELQAQQNNYSEAIGNYRKALSVKNKPDWE